MELFEVAKLKAHPRNNYFFDDITGDNWQDFLESVRTSGIIEALVLTQEGVIVSGHQRARACKELGIEKVLADVRIYEDEDKVIKDLIETNIRQRGIGNPNAVKLGRCIKELERIYGIKTGRPKISNNVGSFTQEYLLEQLGLNKETYRQAKQLADLPEEIQQMVEDGNITPSTASRVIAKLSPEDQKRLISTLEPDKRYTQKEVQVYLDRIKELESREPDVIEVAPEDYEDLKKKAKIVERTQKDFKYISDRYERALAELKAIKDKQDGTVEEVGKRAMLSNIQAFTQTLTAVWDRYSDVMGGGIAERYARIMQELQEFRIILGGTQNETSK